MTSAQMEEISKNTPSDLIEGLLPSSNVAVLAGMPGLGKSFVALSWAAAIAEGSAWFGHATRQAPVVYVFGEGWRSFPRRIKAWETVNGRPMSEQVHFVDGSVFGFGLDLKDEAKVQQFIAAIADVQPGLVIFDSFSTLALVHNENDNAEVAQVMRNMNKIVQATGTTAVLTHFVTKTKRSICVRGAGMFVYSPDTVIIADNDINTVGPDGSFALTTDNELGGKRRDVTPITLHGFYVAQSGVLDRLTYPRI